MLNNIQIAELAGSERFLAAAQVASVIQANIIISEPLDGSARLYKRNSLAQEIINNARLKMESFAWSLSLNAEIQSEVTFDSNQNPIISDSTILAATAEVWDNIAGVVTGDDVIPAPFVPPTP